MIGVFYIGDQRHNPTVAQSNHQPLIDGLRKLDTTNVYDFTKGYPGRGQCPFDEGGEDTQLQRGASGAVQVWDFATSVDRITEDVVIKMRTDVWLTESSTQVILAHVRDIIKGNKDLVFFGCDVVNNNQGIEHQAIEITRTDPPRIQDFIIAARRSCLPSTQKLIDDLMPTASAKRVSGNKTFRALVTPESRAFTVLCHLYLIRKTYYWTPTDSEVYRDFIQAYIKRANQELLEPAVIWWKQYYKPTIGVFYIGHRRFANIGLPNHQQLITKLEKLLPVNVYDFSKDLNTTSQCPYIEGGAVQVWDFIESVRKIPDQYVLKLRTDVWLTPSSIDCILDGVQRIIEGGVDAEFYGSNWTEFLGHERSRFPVQERSWVQDFVIASRRSVVRNHQDVYNDLNLFKPSTRLCGTKVFKSIITPKVVANNVMSQIYLVRKDYDVVDPWQVGYDYVASYPKQWKMPNALPWYISTRSDET